MRASLTEPVASAAGLPDHRHAASEASPRYLESAVITPARSVGLDQSTTLKATFWKASIEETPQAGDPDFVSIALNTGGGRVWRNKERLPTEAGGVAMQPFEGADWRFEGPVSFAHLYVPFPLVASVSRSLFSGDLRPEQLRMPSGLTDHRIAAAAVSVEARLREIEPTNLLLDSWALILAEILVRDFSGQRPSGRRKGRVPARGLARVVDYIEASLEGDLRLAALAEIAGTSMHHFAHAFRETLGLSPHAYVLGRRLRRAERLLARSPLPLIGVAAACGFASQAHFTTAFRRETGLTPQAYRRISAA